MALLSSCLCCDLVRGAAVSSLYTTVVYLAAFVLEVWWIVQADVSLPAPAYIQAATYFVTIIMSAMMLVGLLMKRCHLLLGWLFVMLLFWFPECGLVILMTVHHWGLSSHNGTIEISFWVCRATVNILCIICVHSLYSSWKDEKTVVRRLQNLNMTSVLPDHQSLHFQKDIHGNGNNVSSCNGYRNHGYVVNNNNNDLAKFNNGGGKMINRSASSVSHLNYGGKYLRNDCLPTNNYLHKGIFLSNDDLRRLERIHAVHQILAHNQKDKSEFNPYLISDIISPQGQSRVNGGDPFNHRQRSLVDFTDKFENNFTMLAPSSNGSTLHRNQGYPPTAAVVVHPDFSTQSLDRSRYLRNGRRKKTVSLDNLNIRLSTDDISLEKMQHKPFEYLNRPGSRQASDAGSEIERIKDVAL